MKLTLTKTVSTNDSVIVSEVHPSSGLNQTLGFESRLDQFGKFFKISCGHDVLGSALSTSAT